MKKVVSILLCAVMLIGLLPLSAFAAAADYQFTVVADKTEVNPGDEVKFTVNVEGSADCDQFGLIFDFDREIFEFSKGVAQATIENEDGEEMVGVKSFNKTEGKEGIAVSFLKAVTYSGKVGYITLKVKDNANFDKTTFSAKLAANIGNTALTASINDVVITMIPKETEPTEPPHIHTWVEYAAVEPTCDTEGNIAYKQCSECGAAETVGVNPMPLGKFGWVLGATGHAWVEYVAVKPTCDTEGNIAYQQCANCGAAQTAGENPMPLGKFGWVLSAVGHTWVEHEAVEPTCDLPGNIAYAQCSACGAAQTLGENPMPLSKDGWILGVNHAWVEYAAVEPTCTTDGNIAYKLCTLCGAAESLGENPVALSKNGWILGAKHTGLVHYEAIAPSCGVNGHEAYDYCEDCQVFVYADPLKLSYQDGIILALEHNWVEHEAVEPTCDLPGNIAYKQCSNCGEAWTLGENAIPLSKDGWVLGVKHSIKHVEAKAATTEAEGNVEYWYCEDCGYAWLDEAQTKVTNLKSVIIPKIVTPATGDAAPIAALVALAVMAVFGLALVVANKKRFVA